MEKYNMENVFGWVLLISVTVIVIGGLISIIISNKRNEKKLLDQMDGADLPQIEEIHVTVSDMTCDTASYGYKTPKMEKLFRVEFMTEYDKLIELSVDEQTYLSLSVGVSGTVAIVNGNFYGFVPDEKENVD